MNHLPVLFALMERLECDAMLLTSQTSIRYAVGVSFEDGCVLLSGGNTYLLTDPRYYDDLKVKVDGGVTVLSPPTIKEFLCDFFGGDKVLRLGYEDRELSCANFHSLQKIILFEGIPVSELLAQLRAVKDEAEVACIRSAQRITDAAFSHILSCLTPQMTEVEVALELEYFMRRNGAEAASFPTIAVSGAASALPHGVPSPKTLVAGFLVMDFGASFNGYASDMTRTVVLGKATPEMRRLYNTVLEAQKEGMAAIRAGVPGFTPDAAARRYIEEGGYTGLFTHSFGHGVGLEVHEEPRLSPRSCALLTRGNVVTAEPGIYRVGEGGCRIENMGLVVEGGFDVFTKSSTELIELF